MAHLLLSTMHAHVYQVSTTTSHRSPPVPPPPPLSAQSTAPDSAHRRCIPQHQNQNHAGVVAIKLRPQFRSMCKYNTTVDVISPLKPILLVFLPISFLLLLLFLSPRPSNHQYSAVTSAGIRIRPGYSNYDDYVAKQLNKTLNPRLRHLWKTRDWDRKVHVFSSFFNNLVSDHLLSNSSRSLCIGARVGQEVAALRGIGVTDAVGMDLVPYPPLVVKGDFHNQPFSDETFDFEFSNVFDHALYPERFVGEVERTLKVGGVCVLHVALKRRGDKYSANDLFSVDALAMLFRVSEVVRVTTVDGFGLDTEVVLRKTKNN